MPFTPSVMEVARSCLYGYNGTTPEKRVDQQVNPVSLVPSLEAELEEAHTHIFENEKRTHRKKLEQFLRKVSEDRRELLGGAESTRRSEQSSTT